MLFEAGLFFARRMPKRGEDEYAESEEEAESENTIMPSATSPAAAVVGDPEPYKATRQKAEQDSTIVDEGEPEEEEPYEELTDEEMDAELDRMDEEDEGDDEAGEEMVEPDSAGKDKDEKQ
jgi:hypothetical protein